MSIYNLNLFSILLLSLLLRLKLIISQETTFYVKYGDTIELCDNRTTSIYAYEYRSFDGKTNLIIEPLRYKRYSNPYLTSLLRIDNVIENDSGLYKCPLDDTEWQKLEVYLPIEHVYMNNLHRSSSMINNEYCKIENNNCLHLVEGEPLDIICGSDGFPRPSFHLSLDKKDSIAKIMALATDIKIESIQNDKFKGNNYENYRILGLTSSDHGKNLTCHVDMKHINQNLILSSTKQLYIEFRPFVLEKSKKIYCGINQTRTINCTVLRANPTYINYEINSLSSTIVSQIYDDQHGFYYTFDIKPTSIEHFHSFNVTANNSIGFDTCTYELIHGGVPDAITDCIVDRYSSNTTITINCKKSYAQGDNDGYSCTLFKYNDKSNNKIFEEIARTKSCIFALENFYEPVEFRVSAFNRYGSLPPNIYGYIIRLNEPTLVKETTFGNRKFLFIIGTILISIIVLFFLCCLCGICHKDQTKLSNKYDYYQKQKYLQSSPEGESLKTIDDNQTSNSNVNNNTYIDQNGPVYDIPSQLINDKYSLKKCSFANNPSVKIRTHIANNKFYDQLILENQNGQLSTNEMNLNEGKSENDSNLILSSILKGNQAPLPKPRYSTLNSIDLPINKQNRTSLPLPKPRSRSNSRTRLNHFNTNEILSYRNEERPVSSIDSGFVQLDLIGLSNNSQIDHVDFHQSSEHSLQTNNPNSSSLAQQT